jgi:hypothetical protein
MTDKKPKKEKPGYDIKITRRATVDDDFNYYEFEATIDPSKIDGVKAVRDIEKIVTFARELTASEKPRPEKKAARKKRVLPIIDPMTTEIIPESTEDIKIADLKHGDKVNISVKMVEAIDPKEDIKSFISKADGSAGRYVKFDVTDDSGTMKLTLFGDQVDDIIGVKADAWLTLENAYCKDYKGKLELSIAYGTMEVVYNG